MKARILAAVLCLQIVFVPSAHAGTCILGFCMGEENLTLGAILSQAIQQVKFLSDLATMTRVMKENIEFIKDVYGTADDIINARWEELTRDFLVALANSDPNLREIYSNTSAIVENRVPRGNGFRRLLGTGLNAFMFEAFGPYPFGDNGNVHAYTDYRAMSLTRIVEDQQAALAAEHRAVAAAWRQCERNPAACERSQAALQMQTAQMMNELRATENERAQLEAHRARVESGEKRRKEKGNQTDLATIADSFRGLHKQTYSSSYADGAQ